MATKKRKVRIIKNDEVSKVEALRMVEGIFRNAADQIAAVIVVHGKPRARARKAKRGRSIK